MSKTSNINSDYGYLNILLNNTTDDFIVAEYNETQRQPILTSMQDFKMGVVRLKIPTSAVPLLVFEDDEYVFGFSIGANDTDVLTRAVTYDVKSNTATQRPMARYVYYYNQFLTCMNNALQRLWDDALIAYPTLLGAYISAEAPYLRLVKDSAYIELMLPQDAGNNPCSPFYPFNPVGINILTSKKLFYFLSGFSAQINVQGFANNPVLTYKLQVKNYLNDDTTDTIGAYPPVPARVYNVVSQDYPSLFLWQTLTRIIITTTIQIEKEVIITRDDQGKVNKQEVLTDFEIPQTQIGLREYIYFYPQGELRWSNFKATGWLDRFDIRLWFQTKDLQIHPVIIPPTFEASMKIEFKRRKAKELLQYTPDSSNLQYF